MAEPAGELVLALNAGSSSLKFALFERDTLGRHDHRPVSGKLTRIGLEGGRFEAFDAAGRALHEEGLAAPDHLAAVQALLDWLEVREQAARIRAIGHRLVHGGADFAAPVRIDEAVLASLKSLLPLAPDHLPQAIAAIEAVAARHPDRAQIACFDTAFHRTMPRVAQLYALPRALT
jgi:acetate kinase